MIMLRTLFLFFVLFSLIIIQTTISLPISLLYDHNVKESRQLQHEDDVSSDEIKLKVPIVFFGVPLDSIFVNSNGLISFQTEIPTFFNIEFPLDYPVIAPFYSNVDTRGAGTISYYETSNPVLLKRATERVKDTFSDQQQFEATNLFIVTWFGVGYYNKGSDRVNTYQVIIITNGRECFVELLYPENGIQWIQGSGDDSGLPDARAQAGFISLDGKVFMLPGSGKEQVRNLEKWSNINLKGQFIYRIDQNDIIHPDLNNEQNSVLGPPGSCEQAPTFCHVQAKCIDYPNGFCCKCKQQYYGNGKFCVKKDVPLRVNGKVHGNLNGIPFEHLDLQSYIVMADGRAYTAISKIPTSIGFSIQSLQILGGVIGFIFAKPFSNASNGYELTGGVFNHTATINFINTSQTVTIKQKYLGLDVFDQLRLESQIDGQIPDIPFDAKVDMEEYSEQYTLTSPGVIQTTSTRKFIYMESGSDDEIAHYLNIDQVFLFDYCKYNNESLGETWKLHVGKNFISYEAKEQIIRYGLSNKISPIGDYDPCDEGRSKCGPNSACVVENDSYKCVCNPGYQQLYIENQLACTDINECQMGLHDCDRNAQCINEIGRFYCQCNSGFHGDGRRCENLMDCRSSKCPDNSECIELDQRAQCQCVPGYTGDGFQCDPIVVDQSCHTLDNCHKFANCNLNRDTNQYICVCLSEYEGDGYNNCEKIQVIFNVTEAPAKEVQRCLLGVCWCPQGYKIEKGTSYCIEESTATEEIIESTTISYDQNANFDGSNNGEFYPEAQCLLTCFCPAGFKYIEKTNSCLPNITYLPTKGLSRMSLSCNINNNCHRNAQCIYSQQSESFSCQCNPGFEGNGYHCEENITISCTQLDNCDTHATCTYNQRLGKSKCVCNPGYDGDGLSCKIIAICSSNVDCTDTEECLYTNAQRYECVCKEGYTRDSQNQCVQAETCGGGICVENAECLYDNEYEIHYCSCKTGYIGDGITECKLKPIGCNVLNNCGLHATCQYDESTTLYQCKCDRGFYGDGFVCYTEINCHVDPGMCDPQAICVTDANRRYICQCNQGFTGNGTHCKKNQKHEGNFLLLNQGMATLRIPFENARNLGKPIQIKLYQTAVGLDIDCLEGRVYWSDINGMAIRSSSYNGSSKIDFIKDGIGSPEGLAIDWVSRNIYWTDSTRDTIEVANIDSKRRRVLFDTNLINPRGIAVHPQRGKIFWTDWDRRNPKIEWANADGTGREIYLHVESESLPNSLTIDFDNEQLCYADAGTKKIECVDIDSRSRRTIAVNCTYPFGITTTNKHIYWSDWISKKIERVDKHSLSRLVPIDVPLGGSGNKLFGLVAVPESCPHLTNVCEFYKDKCPLHHICLPNGSGSRTCVCSFNSDDPSEQLSCNL